MLLSFMTETFKCGEPQKLPNEIADYIEPIEQAMCWQ